MCLQVFLSFRFFFSRSDLYLSPATDLLLLALQIILALGNRPKAEKFTYTTSIAVYALLSLYLIANTVVLAVKAWVLVSPCLFPLSIRSLMLPLPLFPNQVLCKLCSSFWRPHSGLTFDFSPLELLCKLPKNTEEWSVFSCRRLLDLSLRELRVHSVCDSRRRLSQHLLMLGSIQEFMSSRPYCTSIPGMWSKVCLSIYWLPPVSQTFL